ncbi:hypothetical protein [Micromonospora sp. NPDC023888]|uniref:hypothetical protein n=1 Tax=Micromonospora sp. NPDC023888 TaxID=3155607 RepID=UPI0033F78A3F
MKKVKAAVSSALVATAALTASLSIGAPAQAASNPYTPTGVCGSGYRNVASQSLRSLSTNGVLATVYVLKKLTSDTPSFCVVTLKSSATTGNSNTVMATIKDAQDSSDTRTDKGGFGYYAGPVKVTAVCVRWGGEYNQGSYNLSYYDLAC